MNFKNNLPEITHNAAHYLTVIQELLGTNGYARLTDIAKKLEISPGSCLTTLKKIKNRGLVKEDENKFYKLTNQGEILATLIHKNEQLIHSFFKDVLQVSPEIAKIEACKIEHLLSPETSFQLAKFIKTIFNESPESKAFLKKLAQEKVICWKDFNLD